MSFLRATSTVGGLTLGSRVLGFLRDILLAAGLGAGLAADAFLVAFKLPNLFRRLFAEGAFNAAFVPIFTRELNKQDRASALAFASQALTVLFWTLLVFVLIMEGVMPWALRLLAPGFIDNPAKFSLAVDLTRITFPYLLCIAVVALLGGILNSVDRFAAFAAAPLLLNLCLIGALLASLFSGANKTEGTATAWMLAWAVCAAGGLQLVWMWVATRRAGLCPRVGLCWRQPSTASPRLREMFSRVLPAMLGAGVYQINVLVDVILASLLAQGSISFLYYADRINQLPLGVIGIAVGTTLLPALSRHVAGGHHQQARDLQNRALEFALLLTVPAMTGFLVLADPIITVLFERGAFDAVQSGATAAALVAFSLGLPAYVGIKVLVPSFFARGDTVTPVRIAGVAVVANVVLNLALMGPLAHVGLALASSIAAWINVACLAVILYRRGHMIADHRLRRCGVRIVGLSAAMGGLLLLGQSWATPFLEQSEPVRIFALAGLIAAGAAFYGAGAYWGGLIPGQDKSGNPS